MILQSGFLIMICTNLQLLLCWGEHFLSCRLKKNTLIFNFCPRRMKSKEDFIKGKKGRRKALMMNQT